MRVSKELFEQLLALARDPMTDLNELLEQLGDISMLAIETLGKIHEDMGQDLLEQDRRYEAATAWEDDPINLRES